MQGVPQELLWLSHVGLLLAGLGFALGRTLPVAVALVLILLPHSLWLIDAGCVLLLGFSPFGVANYLARADLLTWVGTIHHFYLLPLLLLRSPRGFTSFPETWLGAVSVYLTLSVISRVVSAPFENINYVHAAFPDVAWGLLRASDGLSGSAYMLGLNAFVAFVVLLPAAGWLVYRRRPPIGGPGIR